MSITVRFLYVLFVLASLSACGSPSKRICEDHLEKGLINPETLEIADFNSMSREEARQFITNSMTEKALDMKSAYPNLDADSLAPRHEQMISEDVEELLGPNEDYFYARWKAQARLGNKVTQLGVCFVKDDNCECLPLG